MTKVNVMSSINEKGNLVLEFPIGVTNNMSSEEVYARLQTVIGWDSVNSKDYGNNEKSNKYYYISTYAGDADGRRFLWDDVNGVTVGVKATMCLKESDIKEWEPSKSNPIKTINTGSTVSSEDMELFKEFLEFKKYKESQEIDIKKPSKK